MNVLVLGGTRFVGRHIVEALCTGGHDVTVFTRGQSADGLPAQVERLRGDRGEGVAGLAALDGRRWDACVDVSGYTPLQVRASAERLRDVVGRYVFISTVSVYASLAEPPIVESHALHAEADEAVTQVTNETYGPLKVTCERILREIYGDRTTFLRPQIVAGPFDPTGRHTYWVQRAMRGGEVLVPGDGTDHVQVIDGRDLARFVVTTLEHDTPGTFNLAGPRITWASFVEALGVSSPVWVSAKMIGAAGLTFADLPLYVPDGSGSAGAMHVGHAAATAAGLTHTDVGATIADTRAWLRGHPMTPVLPPDREADVIAMSRGTRPRS